MGLGRFWLILSLAAGVGAAGPAAAHTGPTPDAPLPLPAPPAAAPSPAAKPAGAATPAPASPGEIKPVAFTRLVMKMEAGEPYVTIQGGFFCATSKTLTWNGGRTDEKIAAFQDVFREKMEAAGLKVQGPSDNLFDTPTATTDLVLAGLMSNVRIRVCAPNVGDANRIKGDVSMKVEWELYSTLQHRMLATIHTEGGFQQTEPEGGGLAALNQKAFAANVEQLARSPEFRQALVGETYSAGEVITADAQTHIPLIGSLAAPAHTPNETVGSVVMLLVGSMTGSGVLVSNDGYILTDAHVVGDAKEVKVRWSDGLETVGKVVRSVKGRDVALVKSEGRGRDPVPIRATPTEVGETVYAVGAPLGEKFQGTVTRGIVSGKRIIDGFAYIQSDVSVTHGSSGGPLLDEKGRLLGLTVMEIAIGGVIPTGIHLFIPAKDALDFLALDQK